MVGVSDPREDVPEVRHFLFRKDGKTDSYERFQHSNRCVRITPKPKIHRVGLLIKLKNWGGVGWILLYRDLHFSESTLRTSRRLYFDCWPPLLTPSSGKMSHWF